MKIGKFYIGIKADTHNWKKYLLPHAYCSDKNYKHEYFKFYYRWFNVFWCFPRKCECCNQYMDSRGGTNIWNAQGDKILLTVCRNCKENKTYIDKETGRSYTGYLAWLKELWD